MEHLAHPMEWPRVLRRRRGTFAGVAALALGGAVALALLLPSSYLATARILVETPQVPAALARPGVSESAAERLARLEQRLTARASLLAVAGRHGRFAESPGLGRSERVERMREATRIEPIAAGAHRPGSTVAAFIVSHSAPDPRIAAAVANDLVDELLAANQRDRASRVIGATAFFQAELDRLGGDLAQVEREIADYKNANEAALPATLALRRAELSETERRVEERAARRLRLEADLRHLAAARSRRAGRDDAEGLLDAGARRLDRETLRIERALALVAAEDAPDRARLDSLRASVSATPEVEMTLAALQRRRGDLEARHALALAKQAEAEIAERIEINRQAERFEVIERARAPDRRAGPPRRLILLAGAVAALLLGLAAALLAEARDRTIRCAADLERLAGLRPVISVPPMANGADRRRRRRRQAAAAAAAIVLLPLAMAAVQQMPAAWLTAEAAAATAETGGGATASSERRSRS